MARKSDRINLGLINFTYLLALFLSLVPVVAGDRRSLAQPPEQQTEITNTQKELNNPLDLSPKVAELKVAYNDFKSPLDKFIADLNSGTNKNKVDSKKAHDNLGKFQTAIKNLAASLPASEPQLQQQVKPILDKMDATLIAISQVTEPLQKGVSDKASVKRVQEAINLPLKDEDYGKFGPQTEAAIKQFTEIKIKELNDQFIQLDNAIQTNTSNNSNSGVNKSGNDNQPQKSGVKDASQTPGSLIPLVLATLISAILGSILGPWLYQKLSSLINRNQPNGFNNSQGSDSQTNLGVNADESELSSEVKQTLNNLQYRVDDLENNLKKIQQQLTAKSNLPVATVPMPVVAETLPPNPAPPTPEVHPSQVAQSPANQLLEIYHQNPRQLPNTVEVAETEESIENRRLGNSNIPVLERRRSGNYWIISKDNIYYLVPKNTFKINEYNYATVEVLFECFGDRSEYRDFQLIKPAKVMEISGMGKWQLQERGELQFS